MEIASETGGGIVMVVRVGKIGGMGGMEGEEADDGEEEVDEEDIGAGDTEVSNCGDDMKRGEDQMKPGLMAVTIHLQNYFESFMIPCWDGGYGGGGNTNPNNWALLHIYIRYIYTCTHSLYRGDSNYQ